MLLACQKSLKFLESTEFFSLPFLMRCDRGLLNTIFTNLSLTLFSNLLFPSMIMKLTNLLEMNFLLYEHAFQYDMQIPSLPHSAFWYPYQAYSYIYLTHTILHVQAFVTVLHTKFVINWVTP